MTCALFTENKYSRCYGRLMERARTVEWRPGMERHHVVPASLGGLNIKDNLVALTYREHFLAHWLLTKFTSGEARRKMNFALGCLKRAGKWHSGRIIASWQYERAKAAWAEATRGRTLTDATKERMRSAALGRGEAYAANMRLLKTGIKHSPETKAKLSAASKAIPPEKRSEMDAARRACGYRHTAAVVARIAEANRGRIRSAETKAKLSRASMGNKSNLGRTFGAEVRLKMGAGIKAAWADPEVRAKQTAAIRDGSRTPEARARKSVAMAASWARRKAEAR